LKSQRQLKWIRQRRQRGDFSALHRPLQQSFTSCNQRPSTAAQWHYEYACWLEFEGRLSEAIKACRRALRRDRKNAKCWYKLGLLYEKQFDFYHCLEAFSKYLQLAPENVSSRLYLRVARAFENLNLESSALPLYLKALESEDVEPGVYFYLAQALDRLGDVDAAMECLMTLGRMFPAKLDFVSFLMGYSLEKKGFYTEALRCYQEAADRQPHYLFWQLKRDLIYPLVMQDAQQIEGFHTKIQDTLARFLVRLAHQPVRLTRETVFLLSTLHNNAAYIAYHHLPVLPIRQQMNQVVQTLLPAPEPFVLPESSGKRIHLGVMFAPKSVSLGYVYAGALAEQLDPQFFEVTFFCASPDIRLLFNTESRYHVDPAHTHVHWKMLAQDVYTSTRQVRESRLDAFFFTEPAWDFQQNAMALFRVAPVQLTSWMNPGSTGLKNMDYFYSCALMEDAKDTVASQNYSETLIAEPEFPSFIPQFKFPEPVEREHFGLSNEWHLYGCLQNLLKMHPDFDPMIAEILRSDPLGHLVLISAKNQKIAESVTARFQKHMPDVMDRIWIFPELPNLDFLRLLQLLDVVLDPLYYGGGTTTYQALAWGASLVTLPTAEMIGRITGALCKALDYEEAIVDSPTAYVQRALMLAQHSEERLRIRQHLRARKDILFENTAAVQQFENLLTSWCHPHRSGQ
jgi:protein O-GlcNAc transferase